MDPGAVTPSDMAQLRAEFQRMGMTVDQAVETANILARLAGNMDWLLAEVAVIPETLDRIEARQVPMAEGRRLLAHCAEMKHPTV
jgi:hypothetical protein